MRRQRQKNLPPNPKSLAVLQNLPERYRNTLAGETFLIYDSLANMPNNERVLVFSTRKNLELLSRSSVWFLDGTFKVAPHIFTQVFTILGLVKKNVMGSDEDVPLDKIAVPLVFALMSSKQSTQYTAVLNGVKAIADEYHIQNFRPEKFMTDFEVAILNSCAKVFPDVQISCCFFHLGQSIYRRVQAEGLQATYNDPLNRDLKRSVHMMLSLAYVPPDDVKPSFQLLLINSPDELRPVLDYFAENYVLGRPARGRRRQILPQYPIELWNQHEAALQGACRTNNVSEGWHNRFAIVVGKHHPDLYSLLTEIQKEQADTECAIAELSLGRSVRAAPKKKWYQLQSRIQAITASYDNYRRENRVLDYLKAISYNIVL